MLGGGVKQNTILPQIIIIFVLKTADLTVKHNYPRHNSKKYYAQKESQICSNKYNIVRCHLFKLSLINFQEYIKPLDPSQLDVPPGTFNIISFVLELYVNNCLLVLIFIVGGIYLIKEYLVAARIADMKVVIFIVNIFLLKYSFVFVSFQ